jgi:hypothetical protein
MACDTKQALDLLAIVRPDVVFVDIRETPAAVAELLDALALEQGSILTVFVCGEAAASTLPHVLEPLLRDAPLDPNELVQMWQRVNERPPASTPQAIRPKVLRVERLKTPPRKAAAARRLAPRRR